MIDPQPRYRAFLQELEHEAVRFLEHVRILHPDGRQLVDVEKAPVVDLLGRHSPVRQAVGLLAKQRVEQVEGGGDAGLAVQLPHVLRHERLDRVAAAHEVTEPPLGDLLLAVPLGEAIGPLLVA